jgi:flagellar biosynthetic protein FliQ
VTDVEVISLFREAIWLTIKLSAPALVVSLVVGLVISIIQTTTSIQEQTLTFVPKLMAVLVVLLIFASWMIHSMTDYTRELMRIIGKH